MIGETNRKSVQIITETTKTLEPNSNAIERFRIRIEEHINNGWEIKASNMIRSPQNSVISLYALLIKE